MDGSKFDLLLERLLFHLCAFAPHATIVTQQHKRANHRDEKQASENRETNEQKLNVVWQCLGHKHLCSRRRSNSMTQAVLRFDELLTPQKRHHEIVIAGTGATTGSTGDSSTVAEVGGGGGANDLTGAAVVVAAA